MNGGIALWNEMDIAHKIIPNSFKTYSDHANHYIFAKHMIDIFYGNIGIRTK